MHPHPQDCHPRRACLVPVGRAGDDFDLAAAAAVPGDLPPLALLGLLHHLRWRRQLPPLLAWSARRLLADDRRRRLVQVGVRIEVAEVRQPLGIAGRQSSQVMGGEVAVGGADELSLGEPAQQHTQQLPQQFGWRLRTPAPPVILLLGAIQGDEDRQGPPATREGEANKHGAAASRRPKRRAVARWKAPPSVSNKARAGPGSWSCRRRSCRRTARVFRVCRRRRSRRWALDCRRRLPMLAITASLSGVRVVCCSRNSYKEAGFLVSCCEKWAQVELRACSKINCSSAIA